MTTLNERLLSNFLDGTLANAVGLIAESNDDPIERSCLFEASGKLRASRALYKAVSAFVERFDNGSRADTDYVANLMRSALARAHDEQVSS